MTTTTKTTTKLSKTSKSIHQKWQIEAERKGGKGAKVVLIQSNAKKLIYNLLKDSFRPMNITSIYETLKAVVPSPLLKLCLDEMSISKSSYPFSNHSSNHNVDDDGDDNNNEDDDLFMKKSSSSSSSATTTKTKEDEYTATIFQKVGRNPNTTLYYLNQSKLSNNGNGMLSNERNNILNLLQKSNEKVQEQSMIIQSINDKICILLSQPFNNDLNHLLPIEERNMKNLYNDIEYATKWNVNESRRTMTKRKIDNMINIWKKRKRLCIDFLNMMEDCTEGIVSTKKCLSGHGQIEIESDEMVVKQAKASFHASSSRKKCMTQKCSSVSDRVGGPQASEAFIGVMLASNNNNNNGSSSSSIERIVMDTLVSK